MEQTSSVYIIDDDPAVRDSLRWLIGSLNYPVKTFETAQVFLDSYKAGARGCIVLDVRLPGMSGLKLQKRLIVDGVDLPVIIISGHGDVPMAVQAMQEGAMHFLQKPFREQEVLDCVQEALELDERNTESRKQAEQIQRCVAALTPREHQIMKNIVGGYTSKVIGEIYDISSKTVDIHRTRVMQKMQVKSIPDLVKKALTIDPSL
ncbi:Two-component transcriptional response regulator, LuxR family [hydrothermal vent metagenome]|uniref:Two-component transcriptional response regulator, LuxR family n=1 Tax=hydrothermal vent metagenome TaxID=652676 RepID=A0A3B0WG46_9ZZZZ